MRYYLLREVPFGADGVFTPEGFVDRVNFDLANDLGNLLNRTVAMIDKYFGGEIPAFTKGETDIDTSLETMAMETVTGYEEAMDHMQFSVALSTIWQYVSRTNKYIDENEPWVLAKDEAKKERLGNVMAHLVDSLRRTAVLLRPFLTETPGKIFSQLGVTDEALQSFDSIRDFGVVKAGTRVDKQGPIFPRLDTEEEVAAIKAMMTKPAEEKQTEIEPIKEDIAFDDFLKLDVRVAEVIQAEKMKKADRLLKIYVDLGNEKRQIISGIAKFYQPEDLVGKKVLVVANLKPVKLRGELSQGMILTGEDSDGNLSLASVQDPNLPNGSVVK